MPAQQPRLTRSGAANGGTLVLPRYTALWLTFVVRWADSITVKDSVMSQPDSTPARALNAELRDYLRQFEEAKSSAGILVEGLSEDQLLWSPSPQGWSIAECFGHLNATAEAYFPVIDRAILDGRDNGLLGDGPFRHGFLVNRLVKMMQPPPRRRFKVPGSIFNPKVDTPVEMTCERFIAHQESLMKRVHDADGLDLARVRLISPASRWLRMSLGQCFNFLATHQRRHLWQAARVRDHSDFPK